LRGFFGLSGFGGGVSATRAISGFASRGGLTGVDATGFFRVSTLSGCAAGGGCRLVEAADTICTGADAGAFCGASLDAAVSVATGVGITTAAGKAPVAVPQNGQNFTAPNSRLSH